jgi:hypothetical protein
MEVTQIATFAPSRLAGWWGENHEETSMTKTVILAAVLLAAGAGGAFAQGAGAPPPGGGRMAACRDDAQKFCSDKHGPDRRACMEANKDKLSDGCKAAMAARASGQ